MIKIKKGLIGRNAYLVSKVWKLGFHSFINGDDYILRICYLRTKNIPIMFRYLLKLKLLENVQ